MAQDAMDKSGKFRNRIDQLARMVYADERGLPAPVPASTDGSHRESWATPDCSDRRSDKCKQQGSSNQIRKLSANSENSGTTLPPAQNVKEKGLTDTTSCSPTTEAEPVQPLKGCGESSQKPEEMEHTEHRETWMTPNVGLCGTTTGRTPDRSTSLKGQMLHEMKQTGKLNPLWVCTLMGVPVKWVRP